MPSRTLRPAAPAGRLASRPSPGPSSYWALSRTPRHSLVLALPLLLLYEALAAVLGGVAGVQVRNGADVWLKTPFLLLFGPRGPVVFGALVVGGAALLVWRDVRRARAGVRGGVLLRMLGESAAMAVVCALVVGVATAELLRVLPVAAAWVHDVAAPALPRVARLAAAPGSAVADAGPLARLMIALGAGLYEELLFRVVLVGALGALARRVLGWRPSAAGTFAVIAGALLFSAAHHVGALGEPLTLQAFTFRTVAGLFFSALYVLRGFGIAAWTHALYDVGVLALGG